MPDENLISRVGAFFGKTTGEAADVSTQAMHDELEKRKMHLVFPLEVFHPKARHFMKTLHMHLDVPRSYLGLNMLAAYSSAIGTGYGIERSGKPTYMCVWGCMFGMTSSGKSMAFDLIYEPLNAMQDELDVEYAKQFSQESVTDEMGYKAPPRMRTIVYRESHIPTLMRTVMPDNPKGVTKMVDEILEWVNGFNAVANKEGTDEQFWLSAWNTGKYSAIRAGGKKYVTPRVFVNVMGGVQKGVAWKLFKNDRAITGFIFRILFATLEENRIALPDSTFRPAPGDLSDHAAALERMWKELVVNDGYEEPHLLIPTPEASRMHDNWKRRKSIDINHMDEDAEKEVHAGILGKIAEYALRFAGLLAVADMAYDKHVFREKVDLTEDHMARAIKLSEYFYAAAWEVYTSVNKAIYAPAEVLRFATYVRAGYSMEKIGDIEYPQLKSKDARRKKASRELKKMMDTYPKVFGRVEKAGM